LVDLFECLVMHGLTNPKSFLLATFKEGAGCIFIRLSDMRQT
jgi:hypothetical protein